MHWTRTKDGGTFLAQDPFECADTLKKAFPTPETKITSRAFADAMLKVAPPVPQTEPPAAPEGPSV